MNGACEQCTMYRATLRAIALLLASPDVVSDEGDPVFGPSDKIELGRGLIAGQVRVQCDPIDRVLLAGQRPRFHFVLLREQNIVCDLGISEI